jgi:TetR/AcrR family transcriptional repressor of nem operon
MRYPDGHKESVRARIVEAASRALRRDGLEAVSIPKLMKMAGLTHGGFYAHFRDRDELVSEAVMFAARETAERVLGGGDAPAGDGGPSAGYLSKAHVDHPEYGCVLATLGCEGRRQSASVRRVFGEVARGFLRRIDKQVRRKGAGGAISDEALVAASRMVGAVVLARLVQDDALAERILSAAKVDAPR